MSEIAIRPDAALDTAVRSAADDWPREALDFASELAAHYPQGDPLPALAGAWIARQKTPNTRSTYIRQFRVWEQYARSRGAHPLEADFPLAEAFSRYLEAAPTMKSVKGGKRGQKEPVGPPHSDRARATLLSACSSFHAYAVRARRKGSDPFELVHRPDLEQADSTTRGSTEEESALLLAAARADSSRAYALLLAMYSMALRLDSALSARVEDLGCDEGHRTLNVRLKGGRRKRKAVPPATGHAIDLYLDGRTEGPLFQTSTGRPLDPKYAWTLVRRLADKAGIKNAATFHPHALKHDAVTHALAAPDVKLHQVQDFADHRDPRTTRLYDQKKGRLDSSPGYGIAARLAERLGDMDGDRG
ncbi:tyrosine-type recombinase/integrase [Streptomyces durmitorensis]|uniref:Tyrosine-type recombinase/integrase n=1 Tax=Streptomyces durmitorensis TaxID=319947 RepID=A0ABY4PPI9_9ACTN|nr:tyrosine-type recombinase/integrase [Streptomyces durmitorensis]UQT55045.1 tyrosine-type recombinase/integrase [Streptomyces durmitorensis]